MPIFSRRVIQRMLDENRGFLAEGMVKSQARRLNANNSSSLAAEWEVVVLNVLSKIGRVEYEGKVKGPKKPDVLFEARSIPKFVADITMVSDENYYKENPTDYFYECISAYFRKNGLLASGISVRIGSGMIGDYGDRKVKVHLPPKALIPAFVTKHFRPVVESIKNEPQKPFETTIRETDAQIELSYNPRGRFLSGGGHALQTVAYSLRRNPIYNRLKKKSGQLQKCGFQGIRGVFLCDGDCYTLRTRSRGPEEYGQQAIIHEIFRQNSTLSFVVTLAIEEKHYPFQLGTQRYIRAEFYANCQAEHPVERGFWEELSKVSKFFPVPQATPENALRHIRLNKHEGYSFFGGGSMCGNEIQIPSRTLTEILSGTLDYNAVSEGDKVPPGSIIWMKEFFHRQLLAGKTIAEISIVKCPDEDDDWIRITYGPTDSAISKFK